MNSFWKQNSLDEQGFTLTELAIVLAVIGILSVAFIVSYIAQQPTKNMSSDGRDILSTLQQAKLEAIERGGCVGVSFNPGAAPPADLTGASAANRGSITIYVDDGAGAGGISCNAILDGTESRLRPVTSVRESVALTQSPVAPTVTDPNYTSDTETDLFTSISFGPRAIIPQGGRGWGAGDRAIVLRNNPNPANATWWGRVIVTPSGSVEYQTNNNPANEANWSR